jgi:hypothetical protein
MLWKRNLDLDTNSRADDKHVRKENIAKNIWPNTRGGDAGVPDGIMNSTAYTMSHTSRRTSKVEDCDGRVIY